jgi:hypothetical protein
MDAKATAELYYNVLKTPIMKAHARQITYPISFVTNSATNNKERSIRAVIIELFINFINIIPYYYS